ncbi:hypothetical protein [Nannocystis bainbridge]|uniref:Lipoprotein n=1 Tax=Nannocystis bainbridge TaxID=2995303 RepID=A0ABT5ECE4_9BACT|nr:hypothetical protein [Nannocystis bainbridge]MDC0723103.1 hypothetical protein [Nannocystis bainbridge]
MTPRHLILGLALLGACDRREAAALEHASDLQGSVPAGASPDSGPTPASDPTATPESTSSLPPTVDPAPETTNLPASTSVPDPAASSPAHPSSVPAAPPTLPVIPPDRRCGEAGERPTELPPQLARGRVPIGSGTLRPDDRRTIGKAKLHYDPDAWIGTRKAGHRGPALTLEIDRAEVGPHDPWGAHVDLHPDQQHHTFVGPYRFDLRTGPGDPPARVEVTVTREVCPAAAVMPPATASRSLWLSTEAIRTYTYDLQGEFLQFSLDARGDQPRLDISSLGYRHWLEPRPGLAPRLRVGAHFIYLDRVVPGPGTRHDGAAWKTESDARLHVRLRIDPAVPTSPPAPVPATDPCGLAPVRTAVPAALAKLPALQRPQTLGIGHELALGPITFKYIQLEIPAHGGGPYRKEATQIPLLQLFGGALGGASFSDPRSRPGFVRLGHELVRVEPDKRSDRVALRRATVPCPHENKLPAPQAPVHVWLSAVGHTLVSFPGRGPIPLSLHLFTESSPSLSVSSEHASFSHALRPDSPAAFTLDDYLVELVDIVPGPDTSHDGQRWQSTGPLPIVHVQLKVTPQPDGP